MGAEAGRQGAILTFIALISLNLGIMNSIPLPALDGGQMFLLTLMAVVLFHLGIMHSIPLPALDGGQFLLIMVEAARGKPLDQELTRNVNGIFLSGLLLVSLSLLLGDIERLIPANPFF
ncbi:hypothetical protein T484DRAFT_1794879 [Baffinella frigidus]|nr:hypothetical protein T484DRAFT_1794879 [Cryptophyta sp. CCMP2293]